MKGDFLIMKKSIRIMAVVMALLMVTLVFASCGKTLSGKYSAEALGTGCTLEFSGKNVTITYKLLGTQVGDAVEGTYSIDDDKITIEIETDSKEIGALNGTFDFVENEDSIKIGIIEYKKAD